MTTRLDQQLAFLAEVEKLKSVTRATPIHDASRPENSAEHSWSLALWALVLADQAAPGVDTLRAVKMLLVHDIVEIDVGDVPIHSANGTAHGSAEIAAQEQAAAMRIFGLLPNDMAQEFTALWQEFEAAQTATAIYAKSLDRAQPVVLNLQAGGGSWIDYDVCYDQVESRVGAKVALGLPGLWDAVKARILPWFSARNRI
ncbi:hydrolase [Thioclava sp. SK-1]|uniref:HD domain-containing protein n=1 Tax=Thioclava sp. SK-1 TaxID=1889770 RepID=UPI000826E85A|nr:HD domain-containing protein [Thioclava sp. SK-1]OCX67210.1 hydrolase [Thioclava sp. SK-1]